MMPAKYRATAVDNMQQKFGKDRMCSSGNMLADRHTNKHADKYVHHNSLLLYQGYSNKIDEVLHL